MQLLISAQDAQVIQSHLRAMAAETPGRVQTLKSPFRILMRGELQLFGSSDPAWDACEDVILNPNKDKYTSLDRSNGCYPLALLAHAARTRIVLTGEKRCTFRAKESGGRLEDCVTLTVSESSKQAVKLMKGACINCAFTDANRYFISFHSIGHSSKPGHLEKNQNTSKNAEQVFNEILEVGKQGRGFPASEVARIPLGIPRGLNILEKPGDLKEFEQYLQETLGEIIKLENEGKGFPASELFLCGNLMARKGADRAVKNTSQSGDDLSK
ncbi:hypothetical protein K461DRAFT_297436 [Myriangium duriaei CBS 260.36]|uniref:Uncharacterized protein n=1 Tax=Myriangium duriaei CBS 260.36 TaxID=1168546 RepID=A0A9P4IUH2_9PEZI|nr:hypothetical protein K461DRAFT_297436 [Myriangium duriaei CBS 260.36]